ncbi:hypothetical protein C8R46DRAFT_1117924 [Mycena filopes]|nr:hypothetical protein C8R46DRAFT_1117924 [Mycena filopes]
MQFGRRSTPYSYGPFIPGKLPHSVDRGRLQTVLRSNSHCGPETNYGAEVAPTLEKVADYDLEMAKLQSVLAKMVANRALLQYHADACQSISAPIRRLPDELMLHIFQLSAPLERPVAREDWQWDTLHPDPDLSTARIAPLYVHLRQLAQVCASWRDLVLGSPTLWSTIELDFQHLFPLSKRNSGAEILALVKSSLARSLTAPLEIYIRGRGYGDRDSDVWKLLGQHSAFWRDARIWVDRHDPESFRELAPSKGNFPLLRSLHLYDLPADCDFFEIAPRLTELTLEPPFPAHPKLPWEQLRSVSYSNLEPMDIARALSQSSRSPNLTRLAFPRLHITGSWNQSSLPPVVSPVEFFAVGLIYGRRTNDESGRPVLDELLGCLTLHRARVLTFQADTRPLRWPYEAFLDFASRSSLHDTLRRLEISNMVISATDLLESLAVLPRLEALSVSDPRHWKGSYVDAILDNPELFLVDDVLLRGLTLSLDATNVNEAAALVPQLHSFECKTFMQFEDNVYLDFVASRVGPGRTATGPFESSIIYYGGIRAPNLAYRLAKLVLRKEIKSRLERDYTGSLWHMEGSREERLD